MGRGRAKAKQTKVARDLKYRTHETDFGALARELHGDETSEPPPTTDRLDADGRCWTKLVRTDRRARFVATERRPTQPPDPAQPADVAHPALGEPVGGDRRRDVVRRRRARGPSTWCRRCRFARCSARSKLKPAGSSSSATWMRPPEFTQ